jgi:lipopolysaccharide/colanic/teichoic acid biosynthesis glycosyltransferase
MDTIVSKASVLRQRARKASLAFDSLSVLRQQILTDEALHAALILEKRRVQRSRTPFVLMLFQAEASLGGRRGSQFIKKLAPVLANSIRETDTIGWYEDGSVIAVMFTDINIDGKHSIAEILKSRVVGMLERHFDQSVSTKLAITTHVFPESSGKQETDASQSPIYDRVSRKTTRTGIATIVKRITDVLGSVALLLISSPVLAMIAVAIKVTSKGPVIFKQERLGQFGTTFRCFKFRTMYENNDPKIHREYIQRLIGDKGVAKINDGTPVVYKITSDPRVTPIGRFLRRTSLDEFPQFWNVLRGEMSLVGPRPPLAYEFELYDDWHRRRVLEMKPGVTGLWQVSGRSRVTFDDMVRLDLRYAQRWSLWLDLKILLATPFAALAGKGAF